MHLQLTMTFSTDDGLIGRNHIINQGRCVCFISSKILSFQHVINRNNYQNYFFFFCAKSLKSNVYVPRVAHVNSNSPCFKCSVATCG